MPFGIDPGTLKCETAGAGFFEHLYARYRPELLTLTAALAPKREVMLKAGLGADFGDLEGELLYMLVRESTPDLVIEISPCHGYSTNYILAALTRNSSGRLKSFEIAEATHGRPTIDIIHDSLIEGLDRDRLEITIGDATKVPIPSCDFLFLDSCHEAWFAAWYFDQLVPRCRLCFIHDIVVSLGDILIPKAAWTGIRESYQVLHFLHTAHEKFGAAAQVEKALSPSARAGLTPRRAYPERSIFFAGNPVRPAMSAIGAAQAMLFEARKKLLFGDRNGVVDDIRKIAGVASCDSFSRLCAYALIADLGYRTSGMDLNLSDMLKDIDGIVAAGFPDIATFVAALELGTKLADHRIVSGAIRAARGLDSPAVPYFSAHFREYALPFNRIANAVMRRLAL
jgi:hypothetical protein